MNTKYLAITLLIAATLFCLQGYTADGWKVTPGYCSNSQRSIGCQNDEIRVCHRGKQKPKCIDRVPACACPLMSASFTTDTRGSYQLSSNHFKTLLLLTSSD